jgi:protocatechuate 3,4-dioxygenase beta subunit
MKLTALVALVALGVGGTLATAPLGANQAPPPPPPAVRPPVSVTTPTASAQGRGRANQPAPPPLVATGLIVGRVIDAAGGQPVSGAVVSLTGGPTRTGPPTAPPPGTAQTLPPLPPPRILTDSEGRFAFRNLTRGNYSINVTKTGYASGGYGRTRPDGPPRSLQLDDNERMGDVAIRLFKYGSITGLVTDEAGEPIVGAQVRGDRRVWQAGRRVLTQTSSAQTDDRGVYRLFNLSPGEFVVSVPMASGSAPAAIVNTPEARQNLSGTTMMLSTFMGLGAGGIQAGADSRFLLQMYGIPSAAIADGAGRWRTYATTYYPGTSTQSTADPITIGSGEDRTAVDLVMRYVPTSSVSGIVVGPTGPAPQYALRLIPSDTGEWSADQEIATTMTDGSGAFTFLAVPAGRYVIQTIKVPRDNGAFYFNALDAPVALRGRGAEPVPATPPEPLLWSMAPVTVGDADVAGIALTLREGLTVSGRLEFSGSKPRPDPQRLSQVPIVIEPVGGRETTPQNGPPSRVQPDGRFVSAPKVPGKYFVRVGGPPNGYIVQSVMANGVDATEVPIDLASSVANVVVTFTDLVPTIAGTVRGIPTDADPPAIVLFPADTTAWKDFGVNPARMRMTRAGVQTGTFSFGSIVAGDYYAIAIRDEYSSDWMNPGFLEVLARSAQRFTLSPGEKRTVDLTLTDARPPTIGRVDADAGSEDPGNTRGHGPFVDSPDQAPPPSQIRDTRPPEAVGTGSISGVVLTSGSDGSPQPARLARVSVSGAGLNGERIALTDDAGRFTFAWLPAGDYQVMATKPAFLSMFYGSKRSGGSGTPVHVEAGKPVTGIDITMPRGAVVSGIVLDPLGAPAAGVRVQIQTFTRREGERVLTSAPASGSSTTDDHGMYRLYGIRPGTYVISATPPAITTNVEVRQLSESEIRAAIAEASRSTQPPPGAQRTIAPAPPGDVPVPQVGGRAVGYTPVFYPGTPRDQEALEFTLAAGQQLDGINLQLTLVPTARLEGRIYTPNGQPANNVQISLQRTSGTSTSQTSVRQQDGLFQVVGVPAGRFTLVASMEPARQPQPPGTPGQPPTPPSPPSGQFWAQQEIDVNGEDQLNLALTLAPALTFTGRVVIDGAAPPEMRAVRIQLEPAGWPTGNRSTYSVSPDQSGVFTMNSVIPGKYRLNASASSGGPGTTWAALSAQVDGQDALVTPFEIRADRTAGAVAVTLTDKPAEVAGRLIDAADRPVPGMTLALFPTDRTKWTANSTRVNRSTRSGPDGAYRFAATLPGEYYLVVLTDLDPNDWSDPAFKDQLVAASLKVTVGKGEKKRQDMRVTGR